MESAQPSPQQQSGASVRLRETARRIPRWAINSLLVGVALLALIQLRMMRPLPPGQYTGMVPIASGPTVDDDGVYMHFENVYTPLLGPQTAHTTASTQWRVRGKVATEQEFDSAVAGSWGSVSLTVEDDGRIAIADAEAINEPETIEPGRTP